MIYFCILFLFICPHFWRVL